MEATDGEEKLLKDIPARSEALFVPHRLYDRTAEESRLLEAYKRQTRRSLEDRNEIVLITGKSGTGKSVLALTLRDHVEADDGFFIAGKFDQLQNPDPFGPLVAAFADFVHAVMIQGDDSIRRMRGAIVDAIGGSSDTLLIDMIPALQNLLASSEKATTTSIEKRASLLRADSGTRLSFVFRKFLQAICSLEHPVVLFLDDLQWADMGSISLLSEIATDKSIQGFLLLGTCRGNEVTYHDSLSIMLRQLEDDGIVITEIPVSELNEAAVQDLVSDLILLNPSEIKRVATLLYEETNGNAFHVVQLVRMLQERGVFLEASTERWLCCEWEDEVTSSVIHGDIVRLLANRIGKLPSNVQEMLMVAASIGARVNEEDLRRALGSNDSPSFEVGLRTAQHLGLVTREEITKECRFTHDRIQQAAYSLVSENERPLFHLSIGRRLCASLSEEELSQRVFLVANQLCLGIDLIQGDERDDVAQLCLLAGKEAMRSSAFSTAAAYFGQARSLLNQRHWRDQYALSLDLFNSSAEAEYCLGNFQQVDTMVNEVLENARSLSDRIPAHATHIFSLGSRNQLQRAIDTGFKVLRQLGERFPRRSHILRILLELQRTRRLLRGKSDACLLNLPLMTDETKLSAMRILSLLVTYTYWARIEFTPLVSMRMVQLSLRYGLCEFSAAALSAFSCLLCRPFGFFDEGCRYAEISLAMLERLKANEYKARVYIYAHGMSLAWRTPWQNSLPELRVAHKAGLLSGDIEFSMLAAAFIAAFTFYSGHRLEPLLSELTDYLEQMKKRKQDALLSFISPIIQVMLNFIGQAHLEFFVLTGEVLDEDRIMKTLAREKNGAVVPSIYLHKCMIALHMNDFSHAEESASRMRNLDIVSFPSVLVCAAAFYGGMAAIVNNRRSIARKHLKDLRRYARRSPENVMNKIYLLEAEQALLSQKINAAVEKFELSANFSQKAGNLCEEALAHQRAGDALRHSGRVSEGIVHFKKARLLYDTWGARIKVEQIDKVILDSQ